MAKSMVKAAFLADIKDVWKTVTSLDDYGWRSDLSRVEVLSDNKFVEYTKDGYATTFETTSFIPYSRWEFNMENDNMTGHWTGVFDRKVGITVIEFTEDVTAKKLLMKPFVRGYLRKQQKAYISDLEMALAMR
ncbi:MAG: polyketide cyclase [Lachnospiraceae bacterium]|nr:polyketide cyclase [Lachnospiraceae bacterium]